MFRSSAIVISLSMFLFYYLLYYRYTYTLCARNTYNEIYIGMVKVTVVTSLFFFLDLLFHCTELQKSPCFCRRLFG